jgi:hypothetical protein
MGNLRPLSAHLIHHDVAKLGERVWHDKATWLHGGCSGNDHGMHVVQLVRQDLCRLASHLRVPCSDLPRASTPHRMLQLLACS